jgi:dTDP-4-amino-4,6-dideoxygalactose transaminase
MADICIPFNRPSFIGNERAYMDQCLAAGQLSGGGSFSRRCCDLLEARLGCDRALLTSSCTDALEMCGLLLDIGPEDEFIVPSFTFTSTANAFALRGARPVFADVRPDTLNLDERQLDALITPRTRAVIAVHYAGVACAMDEICGLARKRGVAVIEDNAHGIFGKYKGRLLGTIGTLGTLSFHETKSVSCGEGGALLVNDIALVERAEIILDKGTNRQQFFRQQADKYTWVDLGSSFVLADLLASILLAQLEAEVEICTRREDIWRRYQRGLSTWASANGVLQPTIPPDCESSFHLYHLILPNRGARDRLLIHLRERGILGVFHYQALNASPMGQRLGGRIGQCLVSEDVSMRLVRLPMFFSLTNEEQEQVIDAVTRFDLF